MKWPDLALDTGISQTSRNRDLSFPHGHGIGPDALIIFVVDIDPPLGALGSAGAIATIGPGDSGCSQLNKKGWVVRLYCGGGGAKDQETGSGLTVVGDEEKVPVAVN